MSKMSGCYRIDSDIYSYCVTTDITDTQGTTNSSKGKCTLTTGTVMYPNLF